MQHARKKQLDFIEIIYIFMVITITLISFSLLSITSKRNSDFSKNLVTARLLSQEGIKTVINLKNQNKTSIIIGSRSYTWSQLFDAAIILPGCTNPSDLAISCADFSFKDCNASKPYLKDQCIELNTRTHIDESWKIKAEESNMFSKKIRITNAENNAKNITVFVWWIDAKGLHTSPITYKLMQNQ